MNDDIELIGGIERRNIVVVPYNPEWPKLFTQEEERIRNSLGVEALRVDHVGSTSIPGLAAKPIIDIQLSVEDADAEGSYLPQLESAGYLLRVRQSGHRMVRTADQGVQIHICSRGSDWERRHLLLRDWLRVSEDDRERYASLKRELAKKNWESMNHYADAKSGLIEEMTRHAEDWAVESDWHL